MNSYKTWTIEEDKKLWQLYGKCKTKELAREMNRTEEVIRQRYFKIKRNGIPRRIQSRSWVADDGTRRYATEVVAERVEFLEWKEQNSIPDGFVEVDYNQDNIPF